MAHFAKIDPDTNLVLAVHVVNNSDCLDSDGVEQECNKKNKNRINECLIIP